MSIPTGEEFSMEQKIVIFLLIEFVESKRNGLQVPLTSASGRGMALLGISYSSLNNLKQELNELQQE
jgi:hypothetical protein